MMIYDLLLWGALLVGLMFLVVDKRRGYGALTLAYFLVLSLGHVPGVLGYINPAFLWWKREATEIGFQVTLLGALAFIVGAIAARMHRQHATSAKSSQERAKIFYRIGWRFLATGIVSFFMILPISTLVPGLTAIASAMGALLIIGIWCLLYSAVISKNRRRVLLILTALPLLPLATLMTGGFLGFGTVWVVSIVAFLYCIVQRRFGFYLIAPAVVYIGLSLFVTYAQRREEIRDMIWYQNVGIVQRLSKISELVTDFQFLDLSDDLQLFSLDERLNQNYYVGAGVMRHGRGMTQLQYGATVSPLALIPRAIWPDKPGVGGGQDLVSEFTGIRFEEGTSVGVGQVLEFYMNFGMPGVLAGFAVFGFVLMRLDQRMMRAFTAGNIAEVMQTALPGIALLNPLGNLTEVMVSVAAAIIASRTLVHLKMFAAPPTPRTRAIGLR